MERSSSLITSSIGDSENMDGNGLANDKHYTEGVSS
jgi:hypothetical protein